MIKKACLILTFCTFLGCTPLAPSKEEKRRVFNSQRRMDVITIKKALSFYWEDHQTLPGQISEQEREICSNKCNSLVDLSKLYVEEEYLVAMPNDPTGSLSKKEEGSGYTIKKLGTKVIISAPQAINNEKIEAVLDLDEVEE